MVLFEIWSVGKKPFSQYTNNQVLRLVQTGHCQPPPPGCPTAIYKLMVDCWYICSYVKNNTKTDGVAYLIPHHVTGIQTTLNAPLFQKLAII